MAQEGNALPLGCGGKCRNVTSFVPKNSLLPRQYLPPMLHTQLNLDTYRIKASRRTPAIFKKSDAAFDIEKNLKEKHF
jgi:hypothetical protein